MKPLVIYHADCTDGFGAAFAAWLKLGDEAVYVPAKYGEGLNVPVEGNEVYILDFSFPKEQMDQIFNAAKRVVWLDHHKTAFEMWCGDFVKGATFTEKSYQGLHYVLLNDNKSGALLAWEYFHPDTEVPLLIQHIDDRDRWQWKLDGSAELHAALASYKPWSFTQWMSFMTWGAEFVKEGSAILRAQKQHVESMAKQARKCRIEYNVKMVPSDDQPEPIKFFEFRDGLAVNATLHMSEVGHELANRSGTFGLVYYISADNRVKCSLRSNGEYDVSAIAKSLGGGGHRNAAGFETDIDTLMGWLR